MEKVAGMNNRPNGADLSGSGRSNSLIIAGPCSAESPGQLLETAVALKQSGNVDYFRAGVWKPRTSPDSFQGVGTMGLKWLQDIKKETGLKVATEVGCEKHVLEALKYDIDLLWLGARTVSNPFVVQEIADSLRGVDIPVLVKNPLNPDIELWYGAINRLLKAGIREVGAIHRGFSIWGESIYRNPPIWKIPGELKKRMPGILLVCDPSHIAGKRSLVPVVSRRAMVEGVGGLMVEVHPDPEKAMSDAAQQLNPHSFSEMIKELDLDGYIDMADEDTSIDELNLEIDMVDEMLIHTISSRMELSRQIARIGNSGRVRPVQKSKWKKALGRVLDLASEDGLRPDFIHRLFAEINKEARQI
jgi:chorismate mutase